MITDREKMFFIGSDKIIIDLLYELFDKRTPSLRFNRTVLLDSEPYKDLEHEILLFGRDLRKAQEEGRVTIEMADKLEELKKRVREFEF